MPMAIENQVESELVGRRSVAESRVYAEPMSMAVES